MKKKFILLAALIAAAGCSRVDAPHEIVKEFPVDITLPGKQLAGFNDRLGLIDIDAIGQYMLCREHRTEFFYSLYDSESNLLQQFGRRGRGPGEFLAPEYTGVHTAYADSLILHFLDWATGTGYRLKVDKNGIKAEEEFNFSAGTGTSARAVYHRPGIGYFGVSDDMDCKFFCTGEDFGNYRTFSNVLEFPQDLSAHEIAQSDCCVSQDLTRIAIGWFNFPQIDIRSADGTIIRTIFIGQIIRPQDIKPGEAEDYFLKLTAYGGHIYALFNDPASPGESSILVFDWEGTPLARYRIDTASSFTVGDSAGSNGTTITTISDGFNGELKCMQYCIPD